MLFFGGISLRNLSGMMLLLILMAACTPLVDDVPGTVIVSGDIAEAVAAQEVAETFLSAWQAEDYPKMYATVSSLNQDAMTLNEFEEIYLDTASSLTLQTLSFDLLSAMAMEAHVEVAFRVHYITMLVGELSREMVMTLVREDQGWRIQWERGLIFPELRDGNTFEFVHDIPSRGRIFDRNGAPLAAYEDAIAIGLVPGEIRAEQADLIYDILAEISSYDSDELAQMVQSTPADWYLPIISLSQEDILPYIETLRDLSGVRLDEFRSRFYVDGGVAPHVLGYRLYIPEDQLETYLRLGYRQDERIGAAGLEQAYEAELSGQRGGSLYLVGRDGEVQSLLASSEAIPGSSLYTTIDKTLQMHLQDSLGNLRGAVVVMEVDTGRVLALVSNPSYDPNVFDLAEIDRSLLDSYFSDEDRPLFNRAAQGQYPLGSVFKIITMSTALEADLYQADSTFNCGHSLWVCDSVTLDDWTLSHGAPASGLLNLQEGLMRSCNPWFYRIGESLYVEGQEDALSEMALGFGLGAETGIEINEAAGNIPEQADTCVENAQMAIGQGQILVTPLQVAVFMAALANGGTLYQPALVDRMEPASGDPSATFSLTVNGKLPISEETLQIVTEALRMVVAEPRGTGYLAMAGLDVTVYGKTGTAQTPSGDPHAWFAGFTRQNDPDYPDIAVAVIIENGGEGSEMAAPVFRRAVSLYFSNNQDPSSLMPWEEAPFVPKQPTPTPTTTTEATSTSED
jgi:penicillin-binding protein 2